MPRVLPFPERRRRADDFSMVMASVSTKAVPPALTEADQAMRWFTKCYRVLAKNPDWRQVPAIIRVNRFRPLIDDEARALRLDMMTIGAWASIIEQLDALTARPLDGGQA